MRGYVWATTWCAAVGLHCWLTLLPLAQTRAAAKEPNGELRRRVMFGAQLAPVTEEVRARQKLNGDGGVVLEKIFPGTSPADADFKAGDVILAVGGAKVTGIPMFLEKVAAARAGDVLSLDLVRDGVRRTTRVTLKEVPREKGEGYDVIYGSMSHGARLRTIVTRPKLEGRHPAVMLLRNNEAGPERRSQSARRLIRPRRPRQQVALPTCRTDYSLACISKSHARMPFCTCSRLAAC